MSYSTFYYGEAPGALLYVNATYSASGRAGNVDSSTNNVRDGFTDNQGGPDLDSWVPIFLSRTNSYRVLATVSGSGGLAISTGGVATLGTIVDDVGNVFELYRDLVGSSVVLDQTFSTPLFVRASPGGTVLDCTRVIDLGTFTPTGAVVDGSSYSNVCDGCCSFRLYGGAAIAEIVFIPQGVVVDDVITIGGDGPVDDGSSVSAPTYGRASGPACPVTPFPGYDVEMWCAVQGSSRPPDFSSYFTIFPVIEIDDLYFGGSVTHSAAGVNFYGDNQGLIGGFQAVGGGGSTELAWSEYFFEYGTGSPHPPFYEDGNVGFVGPFCFSPGTYPCNGGGPPMIETVHRAFQTDENADGP